MMTDDDSQVVSGEIVGPEGDGQWLPVPEASRLTGKSQKTLYRRVEHGRIPSRKNDEGRIEAWIADAPPTPATEQRLSPIVGVNAVEVRELLAPLAQALTDSQRQSEANLERALRAEAEVARLKERLSTLDEEEASRQKRQADSHSIWKFWLWGR